MATAAKIIWVNINSNQTIDTVRKRTIPSEKVFVRETKINKAPGWIDHQQNNEFVKQETGKFVNKVR